MALECNIAHSLHLGHIGSQALQDMNILFITVSRELRSEMTIPAVGKVEILKMENIIATYYMCKIDKQM